MNNIRTAMHSVLLASVVVLGACDMMPTTTSGERDLSGSLSAVQEVPPATSTGTGSVDAHLNPRTNELRWTVTYAALSGPVTAAHFHGPAMAGQNAGVAVPITGSLTSPIKGTAMLTTAQAEELMAGKWYVNLHTAANPNGELRAQVTARR